jgi:ferredoxin
VPKADIHFEAFGPATVRLEPDAPRTVPAAAKALSIQFNGAGRTLAWAGQDDNLLDFAERQGVPMESGCRSGSCGSCQTRLLSGTVHYANPPDFDIASGHCLPCVATPQSNLVLAA